VPLILRVVTLRTIALVLVCFNLANHVLMVNLTPQAAPGQLRDPDAYMRLVRVETLLAGAHWQDHSIPRSNAPFGEILHWSRPLDVLIIAGAAVLRPFYSWHQAVYWSGFWISPVLMGLSLALLLRAAWNHGTPGEAFHLGLLFLCQPAILGYHLGGRADHHSLLTVVFCAIIATARPVWNSHTPAARGWIPGALAGFGCWISIEALTFIVPLFLFTGLRWLGDPAPRHARCAAWMAVGAAAVALVAILTETPGQLLAPTLHDRLNGAHFTGFLLAMVFWLALARLGSLSTLSARLLASGALAAAVLALWVFLFPVILAGPYGRLDPRLRELWLAHVAEVGPLLTSWRAIPARLCVWLFPLLAVPASLAWRTPRRVLSSLLCRPVGLLWLTAAIVFTGLSLRQIRWVMYAEILWLFPYAILMNLCLDRWRAHTTGFPRRMGLALLIVAFCGAYVPLSLALQTLTPNPRPKPKLPPLGILCDALNDLAPAQIPRIAAHVNYGSELLYRTRAGVLATPYHGNSQGMLFWYETMRLPPARALECLRAREVTHILLSRDPTEKTFLHPSEAAGCLYEILQQQEVPGIEPVPLPENLRESYQLFRVTPPEPAVRPPPPPEPPPPTTPHPPAATAPSTGAVPSTGDPPPAP
jgi:hypothetical protein